MPARDARSGQFPSVAELDAAPVAAAVDALRVLFEDAPRFLQRLAVARPFVDDEGLLRAARVAAETAPRVEQTELLDGHPRIGAATAAMSALSRREQGLAGARDHAGGDPGLQARLDELNERYEARYGFRYVIFVAGRPREAIVALLESTLSADPDPEAELRRGLADVVAIAADRLARLRGEAERGPTIES